MWDKLTDVTVNYWRGLEDPLRTWKRLVPVFNWESEDENETDGEDSGENCPDGSRNFPLRLRTFVVQITGQERALFAQGLCTLFCIASNHG